MIIPADAESELCRSGSSARQFDQFDQLSDLDCFHLLGECQDRRIALYLVDWLTCFHGLNPDGFIEMKDTLPFACDDGSWTGSSLEDWNSLMQSAARQRGTDLAIALRYESAMKSAGFQDVSLHIRKLPVNTWPKDSAFHWIGKRLKRSMLIGLSGMSLKLLRQELNMREDEYQVLLAGVRKDLCDHKIHAYLPMFVQLLNTCKSLTRS